MDLISRQAAIDAINKALIRVFVDNGKESLGEKVLKNVPPAQPEPCEDVPPRTVQSRKENRWIRNGS